MEHWPPNVWHGVVDPKGEPVSPTVHGSPQIEETYEKLKHLEQLQEEMDEMLEVKA